MTNRIKRVVQGLSFCVSLACFPGFAYAATDPVCAPLEWELWSDFENHFLQEDGRVLDASRPTQHSSSESQSYGMFFALVANQREAFDNMWQWTVSNLSGGDATKNLPAWIWGKTEDGQWGVLDPNSASDADLWFVYVLLEAGRLWNEPRYTTQALALLDLIEEFEVSELQDLGMMMLPGKEWFADAKANRWVLNPSYFPLPVLRRLETQRPRGPWPTITNNAVTLLESTAPHGFAPDWVGYVVDDNGGRFTVDTEKGPEGSYDAIRTYLWAGLSSPDDPLRAQVLAAIPAMAEVVRMDDNGVPPESVDTRDGLTEGHGPFGFSAALVPYLVAMDAEDLAKLQTLRAQWHLTKTRVLERPGGGQPSYYDYMLSLFAFGWQDGLYSFEPDGRLRLTWTETCQNSD